MRNFLLLFTLMTGLLACEKQDDMPNLTIPKKNYIVESPGGIVEVFLQTDAILDIKIEDADWLHATTTKSMRLDMLSFVCDANNSFKERTAKVIFKTPNSLACDSIIINQKANTRPALSITSFVFEAAKNPSLLTSDITGAINDDNTISVVIPHIIESKKLIPTIKFNGEILLSPEDIDFSKPVKYSVSNSIGESRDYIVNISINNSIPILFIYTENSAPIDSKDVYVSGKIKIDGNGIIPSIELPMKIKGRGNSTWTFSKKPYRIKFDQKQSLAGFPAHKDWVLLANFSDKTALRTELAFDISRRTLLSYTPRTQFIDVIINDVYNGTYQLTEQLKVDQNRVNTGIDGYLLEVDQRGRMEADDIYFETSRLLFNIKDSGTKLTSESTEWIKNHITTIENVLYSAQFADPINGYAKYIDPISFADWYLVNEIAKNNDAIFWTSCFMNITKGEKLKMGPNWDYDISFGNCIMNDNFNTENLYIKNAPWISRLFEDPAFVKLVKERFEVIKSQKDQILQTLNKNANMIELSQSQNNAKWNTLFHETWVNYAIWGTYDNEVSYLKQWFNKRMAFLEMEFSKM